jgi:hypothetical protein
MKELHRQGVRVRSRKIGGGGYEIVPIGERRKRAISDPFSRKSRADPFARSAPRTVPVRRHTPEYRARPITAHGNPQYYRRVIPDRRYQSPESPAGYHGPKTSISGKIVDWNERRQIKKHQEKLKEIELKKSLESSNESLKQERIAQERTEAARQVEKNRLHEEAVRFEREQQAERLRSNAPIKQDWHGGQVASMPQKAETAPRQEPKASQAQIQEARVNMIEEGE